MYLMKESPQIVKGWINEVNNQVMNKSNMVQFHALCRAGAAHEKREHAQGAARRHEYTRTQPQSTGAYGVSWRKVWVANLGDRINTFRTHANAGAVELKRGAWRATNGSRPAPHPGACVSPLPGACC